jgi:hypothetical protein
MTNKKFSMTNFQFRRSSLVAACRAVPSAVPRGTSASVLFVFFVVNFHSLRPTRVQPYRSLSQSVEASSSDFFFGPMIRQNPCNALTMKDLPKNAFQEVP